MLNSLKSIYLSYKEFKITIAELLSLILKRESNGSHILLIQGIYHVDLYLKLRVLSIT